jgi:uncharacterized protein YoxC
MTPFLSSALHLYLRASVAPDTVWVQQQVSRGGFEKVSSIASGVMTLTMMILAVALVPAAWNFRKTYKRTAALLEKVQADVAPLIKHAHSIADNVDYISGAIRADVTTIHETLMAANDRLQAAVGVTERRMQDFNALLAVVQEEAEGVFVATAATVHGVRTGASHYANRDGPEIASVEVDDDGLEAAVDDEEIDDGNDGITYDDADASRAPRIIRRARTRR